MPDFVIILTVISAILALAAIGRAIWHTCRLERLRHDGGSLAKPDGRR